MTVIVGPRTRLGRAILAQRREHQDVDTCAVLARTADEATGLSREHPDVRVLRVDQREEIRPSQVRIFVCALGPVHPSESPDNAADTAATIRDLRFIQSIAESAQLGAEIIFVSSVLALNRRPSEDREYYTTYKQVVEAALAELSAQVPGSSLSVCYPGRLVDESASAVHRTIHTTYPSLASRLMATPASKIPVIGIDAQLWLALHRRPARLGIRPPALKESGQLLLSTLRQR